MVSEGAGPLPSEEIRSLTFLLEAADVPPLLFVRQLPHVVRHPGLQLDGLRVVKPAEDFARGIAGLVLIFEKYKSLFVRHVIPFLWLAQQPPSAGEMLSLPSQEACRKIFSDAAEGSGIWELFGCGWLLFLCLRSIDTANTPSSRSSDNRNNRNSQTPQGAGGGEADSTTEMYELYTMILCILRSMLPSSLCSRASCRCVRAAELYIPPDGAANPQTKENLSQFFGGSRPSLSECRLRVSFPSFGIVSPVSFPASSLHSRTGRPLARRPLPPEHPPHTGSPSRS